jgi:subtilisin-like proprotein convertase family protein
MNGRNPGADYDQLRVLGSITLTGSKLVPSLAFAPFDGEVFEIIDNNGTDPVIGTFSGLANGAVTNVNGIPLRINYSGGTGNDVTLTVTNLPLRPGTIGVTTGNGDGRIDPNECNLLFLRVTNATGALMTNIQATLTTTTPGVAITVPSSTYPNLTALGAASTNLTAFQFSTGPNFFCGQSIEFLLALTASNQTPFALRYVLQSGVLAPTQSFTNNSPTVIPGSGTAVSPLVVSNITGGIGKLTVSMALTHPNLAELEVLLIPPAGPTIPLALFVPGGQLGTNCANGRVIFDDDAPLPIEARVSPYIGTFRPDAPLSVADGDSGPLVNGVWLLEIIDIVPNSSVGVLSCWSLSVTPATCAAGSGACDLCNGPFLGSITTNDLNLAALVRTEPATTCGISSTGLVVKAVPALTDTFTFTNGSPDARCVTVTLDAPCASRTNVLYAAAFLGAAPATNEIGHSDQITNSPAVFSFTVPSGAVFTVSVSGLLFAQCNNYTLRVDGFDCPVPLGIAPGANGLVIHWPTFGSGFHVECTTDLAPATWVPLTNIPTVVNGDLTISNSTTAPRAFYRLRKP